MVSHFGLICIFEIKTERKNMILFSDKYCKENKMVEVIRSWEGSLWTECQEGLL